MKQSYLKTGLFNRAICVFALLLFSVQPARADYAYATGTIQIGVEAIGTQYSVTGVSPSSGVWKAVKLTWSGRSETTDASGEQDIQPGIGFAVSSTSRRAVTGQSDHSPTTTATDSYHTDAACVALLDIAGVVSALADFVSFNADGFTIVVDDVFPAALEVSYELYGGTDLTNAEILQFTTNTTTGEQDVTTGTFQGDFALFIGGSIGGALPNSSSFLHLCVGAATSSSQAVLAVRSNDAAATSVTQSYSRSGEVFARTGNAPSVLLRVSFTSFLSNGIRINIVENTNAEATNVSVLVLKGGSYAVGNFLTATDLNNFTESVGFVPKGMSFYSANRAESTQDVATAHLEWSVGSAASSTSRTAQYVRDKDASGNADGFSAVEHDAAYINGSNDATQVIEGLMDVVSLTADPVTLVMADADPVASFTFYVAVGNSPSVSTRRPQVMFVD